MVRLQYSIDLSYEIADSTCDFIFNIHAARNASQSVHSEYLQLNQPIDPLIYVEPGPCGIRFMRLRAGTGPLTVHYEATVDLLHHRESPENILETPIAQIPGEILQFLYPSRYCQSDRLRGMATREFGHLPKNYERVKAIEQWVRQRTLFTIGISNSSTSAIDTLLEHAGVCRDFAHLMIALCRALNIPARIATSIDYGADPALGPTDFHAYVEVFMSNRWYMFDPTGISPPMGLPRIGTGRDAADVSFATMFGMTRPTIPVVKIQAIEDAANGFELPHHSDAALSPLGEC